MISKKTTVLGKWLLKYCNIISKINQAGIQRLVKNISTLTGVEAWWSIIIIIIIVVIIIIIIISLYLPSVKIKIQL